MARLQPGDLFAALALLTRLPVPDAPGRHGARAAWAWPLAGAIVGGLGALAALAGLVFGLSGTSAAALALGAQVVASGAMHEDGLADCADGFWGGRDVARRLEIMKDSRIGTYGVLALILSMMLRWSLIGTLLAMGHVFAPLVAAGALSRVPMVALMHWLPGARDDGLSARTGRPDGETLVLAAVVGLLVGLLCTGFAALGAAVFGAAGAWGVARIARRLIGGQTGDVLGASQQLAEIGLLAGFALVLPG